MNEYGLPIRGEVRHAGFRRVSHGLFLPDVPGLSSVTETLRELAAWRLVLPASAAFTHLTAAWLNDWWLPMLPEFVPVFAAVDRIDPRPRRAGLVCSRLERTGPPGWMYGLPVEPPTEVLLRAARDVGTLDLVVMVDSALRSGLGRDALADVCGSRRPGVVRLRKAASLADARSESPGETLLRVFHVLVGVEVEPQKEIYDGGSFVARGDLWLPATGSVHEYDGADHLKVARQVKDLRRARRMTDAHVIRRGYTLDDMISHPLVMLQELDRALGRPHRASRLTAWRRLVAESSYTPAGRNRLQNRWLRAAGGPDWARTA